MSHNEYVKFITEQLVTAMNTSKQDRKKKREKKKDMTTFSNRWFGLFPFTIKLMLKK